MTTNNSAAVAASAALRGGSPQLLHNKHEKSPFSNPQYSAIRQSANNPHSPIQGHQSYSNAENYTPVRYILNLFFTLFFVSRLLNIYYSKILSPV